MDDFVLLTSDIICNYGSNIKENITVPLFSQHGMGLENYKVLPVSENGDGHCSVNGIYV